MKFSHWETGDYPIYIDPDIKEIIELAETRWDTVRINVYDDGTIAMASGYGNTHDSVNKGVWAATKNRDRLPRTFILYYEFGVSFFNCEDISGKIKTPWKSALKRYFEPKHQEILTDLISISEDKRNA